MLGEHLKTATMERKSHSDIPRKPNGEGFFCNWLTLAYDPRDNGWPSLTTND